MTTSKSDAWLLAQSFAITRHDMTRFVKVSRAQTYARLWAKEELEQVLHDAEIWLVLPQEKVSVDAHRDFLAGLVARIRRLIDDGVLQQKGKLDK